MIPKKLLNSFLGYCKIECEAGDSERVLNLFMKNSIINWKFRKQEDKTVFFILESDIVRFFALCEVEKIKCEVIKTAGFLPYLRKYKKRLGIPIGFAIFFIILWVSGLFIWEINISGNSAVKEEEIIERLSLHGCKVGTYIPSIDYDSIYNRLLMQSDDLSWISINMRGTVANVEVRETEKGGNIGQTGDGANLTAAQDGQIEQFEIYAGAPAVNVGDSVRAGDLLVSGIIESKNFGHRYVYAKGKVYARVTKEIVVKIPLKQTQKSYTGKEIRDTTVKIFGKTINISSNSGNIEGKYDKIEKREQLGFFCVVSVPVYIETVVYREYEFAECRITEIEAVRQAYNQLKVQTASELKDADLLKRSIDARFEDDSYFIYCSLYCIEDIAQTTEFELSE